MKKEYKIVRRQTVVDLEEDVTTLLNSGDGWELVGGICVDSDRLDFYQAMVRDRYSRCFEA